MKFSFYVLKLIYFNNYNKYLLLELRIKKMDCYGSNGGLSKYTSLAIGESSVVTNSPSID